MLGLIITFTIEMAIPLGLMMGSFFALLAGVAKIEPVDRLDGFAFKRIKRGYWIFGLIIGLLLGLMMGLIVWEQKGWMLGVVFGLLNWLGFSLSVWLMGGKTIHKIERKEIYIPNQGIFSSLKNSRNAGLRDSLISSLLFGLVAALTMGLIKNWMIGLIFGMKVFVMFWIILGIFNAFSYGLLAVIQHCILRLILYWNGDIPWNYAKFLAHAVRHKFIQRVGGRYIFMHDLLRKHFANNMPLN